MKKILNGDITLLASRTGVTIELRDRDSIMTFARVELTPEQYTVALSREAHIRCDIQVSSLDRVGKMHEHQKFEFKVPDDCQNQKEIIQHCQKLLDAKGEGWIADSYLGSRDSFFTQDGERWCRVTIRRWTVK